MRQQLLDFRYRLEFCVRYLSGRTTITTGGHVWSTTSPNAVKSVRELTRSDPLQKQFLADAGDNDVFLDVGANYGSWTIDAATGASPVRMAFALEPAPGPYLALLENLWLNQCQARVRALPIAAGAALAVVPFRLDTLDPSGGTSHVAAADEDVHQPTGALWRRRPLDVAVPAFAIDDLLARGAIAPPTLVKIDTEGYEGQVLLGMRETSRGVRRIFVEVHPDRLVGADTPADIVARLREHGFAVTAQVQRGRQVHLLCDRAPEHGNGVFPR
jgi:FkbM family methyltransferase